MSVGTDTVATHHGYTMGDKSLSMCMDIVSEVGIRDFNDTIGL